MIALEKGITFNGEHSYRDHKLILQMREIGLPSKNKILETIPFSNAEYDFSKIFGDQTYGSRTIVYTFTLFNHHNIPNLEILKIICVNWLMRVDEQSILRDDEIENYYFLGEVRDGIECSFDALTGTYEVRVTFTCYPFKIGELAEGNDLWDPFIFEIDVFQDTKFTINGSKMINIINPGVSQKSPTVICSSAMTVTQGGSTYSFPAGTNQNEDFIFKVGENKMAVIGNGTIEFVFHKELL